MQIYNIQWFVDILVTWPGNLLLLMTHDCTENENLTPVMSAFCLSMEINLETAFCLTWPKTRRETFSKLNKLNVWIWNKKSIVKSFIELNLFYTTSFHCLTINVRHSLRKYFFLQFFYKLSIWDIDWNNVITYFSFNHFIFVEIRVSINWLHLFFNIRETGHESIVLI